MEVDVENEHHVQTTISEMQNQSEINFETISVHQLVKYHGNGM